VTNAVPQIFVATLTVSKAAQAAIVFNPAPTQAYNTTNALSASGGSGTGLFSYAVESGPGQIVDGTNLWVTNGTGAIVVSATKAADANYLAASTNATVTAMKATATVTFDNLAQIYDGSARVVTATTAPTGLTVNITYDGNTYAPTNIGSYAVTGVVDDVNYQGTNTGTLVVGELPAPTALAATLVTSSNFVANWTAVATATNYFVDVGTTNDFSAYLGGFGNFAAGDVLTCTVTGVVQGSTYYYRVRAQNAGMTSTNSGTIDVTINAAPSLGAATVSNVMATTADLGGSVTATNGYPVTERGIYWGTNSGTVRADGIQYADNGVFDVGAFSFFVTNLPAGRTNYFLAYAANDQGTNVTAESSFLTRPGAPAVLAASNGTVSAFWANWQAAESATNYFVDAAATNDFTEYLAGYSNRVVGAELTCLVTGLQARTVYYYRVRAENATGIGGDSATQTVAAAALALTPASLDYTGTYGGANPAAQSFALTNSGDRGLDFTNTISYSEGATGWWTATPATGSVNGLTAITVTGAVDLAGLNAGVYYATNSIASSDVTNAVPQIFVATLTVGKAAQTITFPNPGPQVITNTVHLSATASSGLAVTNFGLVAGPGVLNGTNLTFTNSGAVSVRASQAGDTNWNAAPDVIDTFNVSKIAASVFLGNLTQTYDGTAKSVTVTTAPTGLTVVVTYDGNAWAPTNAGTYAVSAVVNETLYEGATNGTLTIIANAPPAPTGLTASKGTYTDRVALSWTAVSGAAGYEVWRSASSDTNTAVKISNPDVAGTSYDDTSATNAVLHTYWVKTKRADGVASAFSAPDTGWRGLLSPVVSVIRGLQREVRVAWSASAGATSYELWKNTIDDSSSAELLAGGSVTLYRDMAVLPGTNYFYWVKALCALGDSGFGASSEGWCGASKWDFNGDGRAEPWYYNEAGGRWYAMMTTNALSTAEQGGPGWDAVPADYDGDGKMDLTVYNRGDGAWQVLKSGSGYEPATITDFGGAGFTTAVGDYDGDGKADPAIYAQVSGTWQIAMSANEYRLQEASGFGAPGYRAVPADYDGDGRTDPAVYEEVSGDWVISLSGSGYQVRYVPHFGQSGFAPVPGDYEGRGYAQIAVYQELSGNWIIRTGSGPGEYTIIYFGHPGYAPIPADYDGDRYDDEAVFFRDRHNAIWYLLMSTEGLKIVSGRGSRP
jgi:hypothetical protein